MKRSIIAIAFSLLAGLAIGQNSAKSEVQSSIVGRWDYFKTVNPDGSEEYGIMGREHYYSDGTVLYLNMWLNPFSIDSLPKTQKELLSAFQISDGGIGTYEVTPEKNLLRITLDVSTDTAWIGKPFELKYEIIGDTIVFRDLYHFVRVKE